MSDEKNILARTEKLTDLLLGMNSVVPYSDGRRHFLLADFDRDKGETWDMFVERVMAMVSLSLFEEWNKMYPERLFRTVYLVKSSDFGLHLVCFDISLDIGEYVRLLSELDVDYKFIEWVERVKYGVLRLSRRSKHNQVPELYSVLMYGKYHEETMMGRWYRLLLSLERMKADIRRVVVYENKK